MDSGRVMVFMRVPQLGRVKTRLGAVLGAPKALEIYRSLVGLTVAALAEVPEVEVRYTPEEAGAEWTAILPARWRRAPQGGGDLGDRLEAGFRAAFEQGKGPVLAVGTDCPGLCAGDISRAWETLQACDLVVGPAEDGGYWAIGMNSLHPEVFRGVPWGGSDVCAITLRKAAECGLQTGLLRTQRDVDTAEDWQWWLDRTEPGRGNR